MISKRNLKPITPSIHPFTAQLIGLVAEDETAARRVEQLRLALLTVRVGRRLWLSMGWSSLYLVVFDCHWLMLVLIPMVTTGRASEADVRAEKSPGKCRSGGEFNIVMCSLNCVVWCVQYAVCSVQCEVCSVQCAVCRVQCSVKYYL